MDECRSDGLDAQSSRAPREDGRLRRPALNRVAPIRDWRVLRESAERPGNAAESLPALMSDLVAQSVDAGYRVIDEYLRAGQRVAEQLSSGYAGGAPGRGPASPGTAGLDSLLDLALTFWGELFAAFATFDGGRDPAAAADGVMHQARGKPVVPELAAVALAARPGEPVSTTFPVGGVSGDLRCSPLVARDHPPIASLAAHVHAGGVASIIVLVPEGQPAGEYMGAITSSAGTLLVATVALTVECGE